MLDGFQRNVHELLVIPETGLAYVPIFGDGIHGRNPNPGHVLCVIDLLKRKHIGDIDLSPYSRAAHGQAWRRWTDLHHLREQRGGRGDRSENPQDDRRHRYRLDQRSPARHRERRPAPLHRQRGRRHGLGDRRAEPQAAGKDQDAAGARGHRGLRRRPHGRRGQRRAAGRLPDRHGGRRASPARCASKACRRRRRSRAIRRTTGLSSSAA